jgi:hypothetical protein
LRGGQFQIKATNRPIKSLCSMQRPGYSVLQLADQD